ncbi:MAG: hypothetical protein JXA69_09760 [Phycisphaerae bacterium]|nr:hypothetical protein [Phycisphaerae bacterium]
MTMTITGLDRIDAYVREPVQRYAELVQSLAGAAALSLTVFGSAAAGTFDPKRHTVRNVLVLNGVDLGFLRQLAGHGRTLGKDHISAPLIMTPDYIQASLDTFPLELLAIQQRHVVLFGEDHFADLPFEAPNVRLQCEREIKALLIGMRQGLLAAAGRDKFVGELELNIAEGMVRTLRGMLWLKGQRDAKPAADVVATIESLIHRSLAGVRNALDASAEHGWPQFDALYADLEAIGKVIDAW